MGKNIFVFFFYFKYRNIDTYIKLILNLKICIYSPEAIAYIELYAKDIISSMNKLWWLLLREYSVQLNLLREFMTYDHDNSEETSTYCITS